MNPKEKEAEKELNSQETENIAEEHLQEETTDQEAPLTKEEELEKEEAAIEQEIEDAVEYAKNAPLPSYESALKNVYWEG